MKTNTILIISAIILQITLMFTSWIVVAIFPDLGLRTLLNGEGLRWFVGSITDNISGKNLLYIILLGMLYGTIKHCSINKIIKTKTISYNERIGIILMIVEFIIFSITLILLSLTPDAILLGISGSLYPSSLSNSIVVILCLIIITITLTYGLTTGNIKGMQGCIHSLTQGINKISVYIIIYMLYAELYKSIKFVLNIF